MNREAGGSYLELFDGVQGGKAKKVKHRRETEFALLKGIAVIERVVETMKDAVKGQA